MTQSEIQRLIDSEQSTKKKKAPYKKPESVKQFEQYEFEQRYKGRNIPEAVKVRNQYRDDTSNNLTKLIIDYIKFKGGFSTRITSTGTYRNDIKKFVKSTQRKGMADIIAILKKENGEPLSLSIEVKIGKDVQSEHQKKIESEINEAGGKYMIAKNFDQFLFDFNRIIK